MLSRVLLHVIESARPVDATENVRAARVPVYDMNNLIAIVAYVEHIRVANFSQVIWLATRSRIERRAIQN